MPNKTLWNCIDCRQSCPVQFLHTRHRTIPRDRATTGQHFLQPIRFHIVLGLMNFFSSKQNSTTSIMAIAVSTRAVDIPQAGPATLMMVLIAVGIPPEDVSLIFPVDWIL